MGRVGSDEDEGARTRKFMAVLDDEAESLLTAHDFPPQRLPSLYEVTGIVSHPSPSQVEQLNDWV